MRLGSWCSSGTLSGKHARGILRSRAKHTGRTVRGIHALIRIESIGIETGLRHTSVRTKSTCRIGVETGKLLLRLLLKLRLLFLDRGGRDAAI